MLLSVTIFLGAAVLLVPLFKRLGFGAVLGYLVAGLLIGPGGLGLISDVESVLHISELGVVLLLFVIGLELQPGRLWRLRRAIFGAGMLQTGCTTLVLAGIAVWLDLDWVSALIIGFGLAISSTALVLQMLGERKELIEPHGRTAFAILLFQDLSVIPFLAVVPLLGASALAEPEQAMGWQRVALALGAIGAVVIAGRYGLRPALRALAAAQAPEVFSAAALLVVAGTALLMESAGLSMSLGAFLAGVLLAGSEYRHELQADIEPFKSLLLGLFFIAVGMSADLSQVIQQPLTIAALIPGLMLVKAVILFAVGRFSGLDAQGSMRLSLACSQGGEFAFVLFAVAVGAGLLSTDLQATLVVTVTGSMMLTPLLYRLQSRWGRAPELIRPFDEIDVPETPVVLAGFGPFGQIVGRVLRLRRIPFTVLERDWQQVDFVRRFGNPVFYSDATRLEVLRAAHVDKARVFVISVAEPEEVSLRIAAIVRKHFPAVRVFAVARTRIHAMQLLDLDVHRVIRRAYHSSLELTRDLLVELGADRGEAQDTVARFRHFDEELLLRQQAIHHDPDSLVQSANEAARDLEALFEADSRSVEREPVG